MRRTLLLTSAVAVVAATVVPALAASAPADTGRGAAATLTVPLSHGDSLRLDVSAAALSGGNVVRVVSQHCDTDGTCEGMDVYQSTVPPTAFQVDSTTATLRVVLAGQDVQLRWRPRGDVGTSGGGDVELWSASASANNYQGENADVSAVIDGSNCTTVGVFGNEVHADTGATTGTQSAEPLSAFRVPDGATITCG